MDDLALAIGAARDDGDLSRLAQALADRVGVIALVGDEVARACGAVQQETGRFHVRHIAGRQFEGVGPPERVCEGVDLGRLSAARRADRLSFRPPFPPWAERCALT